MFSIREINKTATQAEMDDLLARLLKVLSETDQQETEAKEVASQYRDTVKGLKRRESGLRYNLETETITHFIDVRSEKNTTNGTMEFFDRNGELVPELTRPLDMSEFKHPGKQTSILDDIIEPAPAPDTGLVRDWHVGDVSYNSLYERVLVLAIDKERSGVVIEATGAIAYLDLFQLKGKKLPTTLDYRYTNTEDAMRHYKEGLFTASFDDAALHLDEQEEPIANGVETESESETEETKDKPEIDPATELSEWEKSLEKNDRIDSPTKPNRKRTRPAKRTGQKS